MMRPSLTRTLSLAFVLLLLGCPSPPDSPTGAAGTNGAAGVSGGAGTTGVAGTNASAGSNGNAGTNGGAGTNATAGSNGGAGTAATAGSNGNAGTNASAGTSGAAGTTATAGRGGTTGNAGATGTGGACPTANEDKFSFFLISNAELIRQGGADSSGMFSKYGGNLGGLEGADRICQTAAEFVSPCQRNKVWRAFLSTPTVNAIDRIGTGPWHDRNGRLWSANLTNLVGDRPTDADPAIKNNAPNEKGVLNKNPDGTGDVDNHEIVTGTGTDGRAYTQTATTMGGVGMTSCGPDVGGTGNTWSVERATCWGWTRSTPEGCPRMGRSWCLTTPCTPPGSGSGTNWMSAWNGVGCEPGGTLIQTGPAPMGSRKIGAAGGYGGFYCFAVRP